MKAPLLSKLRGTTCGAALVEYGLLVGLVAVVTIGAVAGLGKQIDTSFDTTTTALAGAVSTQGAGEGSGEAAALTGASCQDIFSQGGRDDGIYTITTGAGELRAACHFVDSGPLTGGWTAVVAQYEASPVGWNAGIAADRADAGYLDTGFSMTQAQVPTHTAMAVGRISSGSMALIDGIAQGYSTGNLAHFSAPGLLNGTLYDVHRGDGSYYNFHDPDIGSTGSDPNWNNTLTFDRQGPSNGEYTWAFSAQQGAANARGYAYDGASLEGTNENFGWVVFVR